MRKIDLLAACVAVLGATSVFGPGSASATSVPVPLLPEELWGYCCTSQGVKCCSRGGCEVTSGGCVRL